MKGRGPGSCARKNNPHKLRSKTLNMIGHAKKVCGRTRGRKIYQQSGQRFLNVVVQVSQLARTRRRECIDNCISQWWRKRGVKWAALGEPVRTIHWYYCTALHASLGPAMPPAAVDKPQQTSRGDQYQPRPVSHGRPGTWRGAKYIT